MTSIVGILCNDGVVIGTDSSATFGCGALQTIEQPIKKINIFRGKCIVAGTGRVGLGQRFCHIVEDSLKRSNALEGSPYAIGRLWTKVAIEDFAETHASKGGYGAVVAFTNGTSFHLCEFDPQDFQPEFKETGSDLWFVSMGSGQPITDPFLGFMRRVFLKDGPPSVVDAIFIASWTLQQAIDLNPGGVDGPPQIATIRKEEGAKSYSASFLSPSELQEHLDNVEEAENYLSRYREILQGRSEMPAIPEIEESTLEEVS